MYKYLSTLLTSLLISATTLMAQNENRIIVPDVTTTASGSRTMTIEIGNTDEVVAAQFTLHVPAITWIDTYSARTTTRCTDHSVAVSELGDGDYVFVLLSGSNAAVKGNAGSVINVDLITSEQCQDGDSYDFTLKDAVLTRRDGSNCLTGVEAGKLTIRQQPILGITASTEEVTEGETFTLTITSSMAGDEPLTLTLTAENDSRFSFPAEVILPAGATSVNVEVTAVEDERPALPQTCAFRVSGADCIPAETLVMLLDNDMPELHLTLTPSTVSEGAGPAGVTAQLTRTGKTDNRIIVHISDDADGALFLGKTTLEMKSGTETAYFNLGPVDNPRVDGNRTYTVTAAVYLSDCSCNVSEGSLGAVSAQLTVIDDDGPTLGLTSSATNVCEGGTVRLTIRRNTETTEALTVNVSSDGDELFEDYDHEVTIPAGQAAVTLELKAKSNDTQGDSRGITFAATCDGYNSGTCFLLLTDQTLPDATISLSVSSEAVEIGGTVTATVTIANVGVVAMPAGVDICLYSYDKRIYLKTSRPLAVGESEQLTTTLVMPESIGTATLYATVNEQGTIDEISAANNTSAVVRVRTTAPYTVEVAVDKTVVRQGETVLITGTMTGTRTANQPVQVYVVNEGMRLTKLIESDTEGNFSIEWLPYQSQLGHFSVGACYPGENLSTEMASFNIHGLRRTSNQALKCEPLVGEPYQLNIQLSNPCDLNLTGIQVEVLSAPEHCAVNTELQASMSAHSTAILSCILTGSAPSTDPTRYEQVDLRIMSAEGAQLDIPIGYYCRAQLASIVVTPRQLTTTMVKGQSRDYPVTITNVGKGESGPICISLPSWISSGSGERIASLAQNDTATIVLRMTPTDDMQLNVPKKGLLGFYLEDPTKGDGTYINYEITPVSETQGTLVVEVTDESTYYYVDEAPHISGAKVEVRNPVTDVLVMSGTTGDDGLFTAQLPEGFYRVIVTADHRDTYDAIVMVDPGTETRKIICLSIQAITIGWTVEETEVDDEYNIVTTVKFETHVPVPVVEMQIPGKINAHELAVGESMLFYAILTNKGLIAALNVQLLLPPIVDDLVFEVVGEPIIPKLVPDESVTVPVKVTRIGSTVISTCTRNIGVTYSWDCGNELKSTYYYLPLQVGPCKKSSGSFGGGIAVGGYGGGGGFGSPNGFIGSTYTATEYAPQVTEVTDCHDVYVAPDGTIVHSVCATISLQFDQTLVLARQAFRGTLTIFNGNDSIAMRDVRLNLIVKDEDGIEATAHEFEMQGEAIDGFTGTTDYTSGWTLDAQKTGVATILFIPTKHAAPEFDKRYSFGGSVTYIDPFSGNEVTRDLVPVTLTVRPTAELDLTYFVQRDVFSDDPLTQAVEASVPAEFSVLINNIGNGMAKNVRMYTNQPTIVENQKDLKIDFRITSSQLNGGDANLAMGNTIATEFGNIEAHSSAYAQWWFESTLLGHFLEYDIEATHVTSYGNPDLSLLNEVSVHELIRSIKADGGALTGFAANDTEDEQDAPDRLYLSDGTIEDIALAAQSVIEPAGEGKYRLTVMPGQPGWNYGRLDDPTRGRARLQNIRCIDATGTAPDADINIRNFWQTDRTMHDRKVWEYDHKLHFIDNITDEQATYELTFEDVPEVEEDSVVIAISVEGMGSIRLHGQEIDDEGTVSLPRGSDALLEFVAENEYGEPQIIGKLFVDKQLATRDIVDGAYYVLRHVEADTTHVYAIFREDIRLFVVDGITYGVTDLDANRVQVMMPAWTEPNYAGEVLVPETVLYRDTLWAVRGIGKYAFFECPELQAISIPASVETVAPSIIKGCHHLAAIEWLSPRPLTFSMMNSYLNPNMLYYVPVGQETCVPQGGNIVVGDVGNYQIERILLQESRGYHDFYCLRPFIAGEISYQHNYLQQTRHGTCQGWESLVLPFDVQRIESREREIWPFAVLTAEDIDNEKCPFWLYRFNDDGTWHSAETVEANVPYILSMPNDDYYEPVYNLSGTVTFTAKEALVHSTSELAPYHRTVDNLTADDLFPAQGSGQADHLLCPTYATIELNTTNCYFINVADSYAGHAEGSVFVRYHRAARPFEAYMRMRDGAAVKEFIGIFEEMQDGIESLTPDRSPNGKGNGFLYDLSGRKVVKMQQKGIYVRDGKKVVMK